MIGDPPRDADFFATTHWSIVLDACHAANAEANAAFERLCEVYWYPLYAYARRRVHGAEDAEDLTQEFFAELLEKRSLASVRRERGRFRAFLLTVFKRFLSGRRRRARALKRGGGRRPFSLDMESADSRFRETPFTTLTPEMLYERDWAVDVLDRMTRLLREECERSGKGEAFEVLKGFLAGSQANRGYEQAAAALGISEGAAAVAAHRLRRRYRELVRAEIARTVSDPGDVDDEIRDLFEILSR